MRTLSFIVSLLITSQSAYAQDKPFVRELGQIREADEKLFIEAAFKGKAFFTPDQVQIYPADDRLLDVWKGNNPYMRSSVSKVNLILKNQSADSENQVFNFAIDFTRDALVFKHSKALYREGIAGYRIRYNEHRSVRRFFYRGRGKQGMVIIVPAFSPVESDRGLLFCPRDFIEEGTRAQQATLQDSSYRVQGASAEVTAEVRAFLRSPVSFSSSEARLTTSPGVSPPVNFYDRSFGNSNQVSLHYKPAEGLPPLQFSDFSNFSIGIEGEIILHMSAGYKRHSLQNALVYVKQINLPEWSMRLEARDIEGTELHREFQYRGITLKKQQLIEAKVSAGVCYLVLYQTSPIIHRYLKEDFKELQESDKIGEDKS